MCKLRGSGVTISTALQSSELLFFFFSSVLVQVQRREFLEDDNGHQTREVWVIVLVQAEMQDKVHLISTLARQFEETRADPAITLQASKWDLNLMRAATAASGAAGAAG